MSEASLTDKRAALRLAQQEMPTISDVKLVRRHALRILQLCEEHETIAAAYLQRFLIERSGKKET